MDIAGAGTPTALQPDVAGETNQPPVQQSMNFKMPAIPQAPAAQQQDPDEAKMNAIMQQHGLSPDGSDPDEAKMNAIMAQHGLAPGGASTESSPLGERMAASFASNDQEKQQYLEQLHGKDNVRQKDGDFEIRENGQWHKFNSQMAALPSLSPSMEDSVNSAASIAGFPQAGSWYNKNVAGISGDPANLARPVAVSTAAGLAKAGGTALMSGEAASGVGAGALPATAFATNAMAGAAGEATARYIAHGILGIPKTGDAVQDAMEIAKQGGLFAAFDAAGSQLVQALRNKANPSAIMHAVATDVNTVGQAGKDQAEAALGNAGVNTARGADSVQAAKVQLQDAAKLAQDAQNQGVNLNAVELFPNNPDAQHLAQIATDSPKMLNASIARGAHLADTIDKMGQMLQPGDADMNKVLAAGDSAERATGARLGVWRQRLLDSDIDSIPTAKLKSTVSDLMDTFGFTKNENGEFAAPTAEKLKELEVTQNMTPTQVAFMAKRVSNLGDELLTNTAGLAPGKVDLLYKEMVQTAQNNSKDMSSGTFKTAVALRNAARDDFSQGIGQVIGPDEQAAYTADMSRYSSIRGAQDTLKGLFKKDNVSPQDLVNYMRSGGIGNADRIVALKTTVQQESPESWDAISKAYFDKLLSDNQYTGAAGQRMGNINWTNLAKQTAEDTKNGDLLVQVLGPANAKKLQEVARVGASIQEADQKYGANKLNGNPSVLANMANLIKQVKGMPFDYMVSLFKNDRAVNKLFSTQFAQKIANKLAEPERSLLQKAQMQASDYIAKTLPAASSFAGGMEGHNISTQQPGVPPQQ